MKKLLIMASLFWPQKNSGGPPISIMNLVMSIKDRFDIYIISKNHEINDDKPLEGIRDGWNQFSFGQAYYVPKGQHNSKNITALIQEVQPDVIYQNSFFSYDDLLPVLKYKKKHPNVKVVVAPRGEFYPERIQRGKMKKLLFGSAIKASGLLKDVYFQGTGQDECDQERDFLKIPEDHILNIQNLSIVSNAVPDSIAKRPGELKLVYIARVHPTKNTLNAIKWLSCVEGNVIYDIYGSIEDAAYWAECEAEIKELPNNIKVSYKGCIEHEKVAETVAKYHAYYMPTTGENFGHSIVEAMLVGRPILISDQTPWTDVDGVGGYAVQLNDTDGYTKALNELVNMNSEQFDVYCNGAKRYVNQKLNTNEIIEQYIKAFET